MNSRSLSTKSRIKLTLDNLIAGYVIVTVGMVITLICSTLSELCCCLSRIDRTSRMDQLLGNILLRFVVL